MSTSSVEYEIQPEWADSWLGESEMARRVRAFDWASTPLGPLDGWPQSLRLAVSTCLRSPSQMAVYWGPELTCIYNDAERDILADLHPSALGQPAAELLRDSWDVTGPQLQAVINRGETTSAENSPLRVDRTGTLETAYFTYSYSPLLGDAGEIAGVLLVTQDTTAQVLAQRRLDTLRDLATRSIDASTERQACQAAIGALKGRADIPFVAIFMSATTTRRMSCVAASREPVPLIPLELDLDHASALEAAVRSVLTERSPIVTMLPISPGSDGPASCCATFIAPVSSTANAAPLGVIMLGISDEVAFDEGYRRFLHMVTVGVSRSLTFARSTAQRASAAAERGRTLERRAKESELRLLLNDLRAAQRRLAAVGDAERRRIERNLHDGAQQRLISLRLELGLLEDLIESEPSIAARRLSGLRKELDEALDELRELAHGLYPPVLASDGLLAALTAMARRAPIPIVIDAADIQRVAAPIESAAYFCCVEAVQNAEKHAGEQVRVTIRLRTRDGVLSFDVTDDGCGFDRQATGPQLGLINLRDRVEAVGGSLSVRSRVGNGTTVSGEIPVP